MIKTTSMSRLELKNGSNPTRWRGWEATGHVGSEAVSSHCETNGEEDEKVVGLD